jgi:hypothetical protein
VTTDLTPGATHIHKARIQPVNSPEGVFACCTVEDGRTQVESDTIDAYASGDFSCILHITEYLMENRFDLEDVVRGGGHDAAARVEWNWGFLAEWRYSSVGQVDCVIVSDNDVADDVETEYCNSGLRTILFFSTSAIFEHSALGPVLV